MLATNPIDEDLPVTQELPLIRKDSKDIIYIREPKKIGAYCVQKGPDGRSYFEDDRELRVVKHPSDPNRVHFDLKDGYIPLKNGGKIYGSCQTDDDPGLKDMLKWVRDNQKKFSLTTPSSNCSPLNTDFITYRGVLSKIMTAPYESHEDFLICASKFKGTIYLYSFDTEYKKRQESEKDDKQNLFCYGGHRFEDYVSTHVHPKRAKPIDYQYQNEYCCMIRTRFRNNSMAYGAEMDCIRSHPSSKTDPQLKDFIEIKTQATIKHERQLDNFKKYKMLKWWAQSYLGGVPKILCGFRDDDMVIRRLEDFDVQRLSHDSRRFWSPAVCLNFLDDFLNYVKRVVEVDDPRLIYKFYWTPGEPVVCSTTRSERLRVIPDWYIESFDKQ